MDFSLTEEQQALKETASAFAQKELAPLAAGLENDNAPLSHDNLYHTTLGLLDVTSPTYQKPLHALAGCRS